MNKLLTISIAAYNVEKYIEKAVLSCIDEKTAGKVEVLVIDDGSRDGTTDIVERLQDQYAGTVRVIKKENGGYGSTINLGVELANGYYFKQLDGDDWIDINGLEDLLNDLERYDVDMVLTPNIKCFESGERNELRDNAPNMKRGEYIIDDVNIPGNISMHSVTYRTQLLRYINLKITEHCYYTDVEYVVYPLQYVKRIYISHVPVYCYRIGVNDQSTGYMGIRKHFKDHTLVLKHIFELYDKTQDKEEISAKWIYYRLITEVSNHYHYLCMLKMSLSHWRLLKKFDKTVRANKKIYKDSSKRSRFVRWLRKSQFLLYPVCYLRAKQNT